MAEQGIPKKVRRACILFTGVTAGWLIGVGEAAVLVQILPHLPAWAAAVPLPVYCVALLVICATVHVYADDLDEQDDNAYAMIAREIGRRNAEGED